MSTTLYSAGYSHHRLCRDNGSSVAMITEDIPPLRCFASGWKFNIFYSLEGEWYWGGSNENNEVGTTSNNHTNFERLSTFDHICPNHFACGDKFGAIATVDGQLYVFGHRISDSPSRVEMPSRISFVACGTEHLIAVPADEPGLYFWRNIRSEMNHVLTDHYIVDAASGRDQYLALTSNGLVFSWGSGKACGQGRKWSGSPTLIKLPYSIKRVFAYNQSSYLLDERGFLWCCGLNKYGMLGFRTPQKVNVFKCLEEFNSVEILDVAVGDTMTYILDTKGHVYSFGDADDSRLMRSTNDNSFFPTLVTHFGDTPIDYISTGCSHVIVGINMVNTLLHPAARQTLEFPFSNMTSYTIAGSNKSEKMNVHPMHVMRYGLNVDDIITTNEGAKYTVKGITETGLLVVDKQDEVILLEMGSPMSFHSSLKSIQRGPVSLTSIRTRANFQIFVDGLDTICFPYGFYSNELIKHNVFGQGKVCGVFCHSLWFMFHDDENAAVTSIENDPFALAKHITIEKALERRIERVVVEDHHINMQVSPSSFFPDHHISDLVQYKESFGIIVGYFVHYIIIKDLLTHNLSFQTTASIEVVAAMTDTPCLKQFEGMDGSIVNVDISYQENDDLVPMDRLWTKHGIVTYLGKGDNCLWVLSDYNLVIDNGIASLNRSEPYHIIRSILKIGNVKHSIIPGDLVLFNNQAVIAASVEENGRVDLKGVDLFDSIAKCQHNKLTLVMRSGITSTVNYTIKKSTNYPVNVTLEAFRGCRFIPGERISHEGKNGRLIGRTNELIWIHFDGQETPNCVLFSDLMTSSITSCGFNC